MRKIKISVLILLLLAFCGCQHFNKKPEKIINKSFGLLNNENDSTSVELDLNKLNNWEELIKRTTQIVCNDSIPKISIKNDSVIKHIYFRNICWKNFGCVLIREKNTLSIYNDTIKKSNETFYSLDSLTTVLKRDIENNGQNPSWSDNPEKLLINVSYDQNGLEKLINVLNLLTEAFEKVTDRKDIKIILNEKLVFLTPPSQPPPPQEL
ncbi:conserved exported protein of unknown function [Tenacibaculum sp. 190130A14a]|uniref:Uncharacterized protein n=1 Tax=Tenacibaculum polynesiense TaxID=3137857 RepID=A0ABM9P8Y8_9FLAO